MLVHSYLYYQMDNPIISDDQWQAWADELTKLQTENPKLCKIGYFDKEFKDWDGSTGMHLPKTITVEQRAKQVLRAYDEMNRVDGFV
jgi:NAD-dependent DNA ligase adenylation domain